MSEARDLNHSYVGTEHLVLGLLRDETNVAAQVLAQLGATSAAVRAETLRLLGTEPRPEVERVRNGSVAAVSIQVLLTDGRSIEREFHNVLSAIEFLSQQARD